MAIHKAKTITITSVKGGVGKTTTVLNLAGIFSLMDKKVLIIDLDLYSGAVAASLNVSNDNDFYKLIDDLNNNRFDKIEDYISKYNDLIDVIPAPKDPRFANKINSKYLNVVISRASTKYDVILIDTNHILDEINLVTLDASDEIIYVISNDSIDLKNMKSMVSIFKDMDKKNYKIVLNNSKDKLRNYFSKYDIKNIIKDNVDYIIPSEFYVRNFDKYVLDGEILTLNKRLRTTDKKAIRIFELIAESLLNTNRGE
ncbi:MAG: AAA family ATPase [Bacilli bacterium]|nr:AAA family ATPase [Bacilli bacterium]MDD4282793.1 AAA family ATPase [Bacilli bacterium]MDD4719152.1 AAA family ATPase [Bacilli bacterium]